MKRATRAFLECAGGILLVSCLFAAPALRMPGAIGVERLRAHSLTAHCGQDGEMFDIAPILERPSAQEAGECAVM